MRKFKTVIFDIGNVLLFFDHHKAFRGLSELFGADTQAIHQLILGDLLIHRYEKGLLTTKDYFDEIGRLSNHPYTHEQIRQTLCNIFTPNVALYPHITSLKKAGFRLLLLSNTSEMHAKYIKETYEFYRWFDQAILSFEVGASKPEKEIFFAAVAAAQCEAEECFYVDDIKDYVEAAKAVGIDAEQYTDSNTLVEQLQSRKLLIN